MEQKNIKFALTVKDDSLSEISRDRFWYHSTHLSTRWSIPFFTT